MDSTAKVSVARNCGDQLGEGTAWDARTDTLRWVDIANGLVHEWQPSLSGDTMTSQFGGELSAAVARAGGGLLIAVGHELRLLDGDRRPEAIVAVDGEPSENRLNDCRCDPAGRLWAGTMSKPRHPGAASLYRLDPDLSLTAVLTDTTLSNGIGFSPSGELMYFIDSTTQRIDVFEYDVETGTPSDRRRFAEIDPGAGLPDGLCVDAEGGVWVALFGGGAVRRYAPDGELDEIVGLPVSNATCPAFGGADLDVLYVTTTRHLLSDEALAAQPLAGALFEFRPGVRGLPGVPFAG